jgi:hypothetical protein
MTSMPLHRMYFILLEDTAAILTIIDNNTPQIIKIIRQTEIERQRRNLKSLQDPKIVDNEQCFHRYSLRL